ncbi:conserved hypothetical protein [Ricinus communis]|uniref:Uncharacterized protein n=1 Tax=Ricinus communis TaxID=3988 RepID=B9TAJ9_RICCO|nr:conserved hypothetical protein [Ricinus communis]
MVGKSNTKHVYEPVGYNPTLLQVSAPAGTKIPAFADNYVSAQTTTGNILTPGAYDEQKVQSLNLTYTTGDHTIHVGMDQNRISSRAGTSRAGGGTWVYGKTDTPNTPLNPGISAPAANGGYGAQGYYVSRSLSSGVSTPSVDQAAQYIEDAWQTTPTILIKAGLRNEQFTNYNGDGQPYVSMRHQLAPRLGATWDALGDNSLKVFANLGRYHLQMPTNVAVRAAGASLNTSEYFTYSGVDPATGAPTGLKSLGPVYSANNEFGQSKDPRQVAAQNMDSLYQDELIIGFERAYSPSLNFGAKLTYRKLQSTIDDFCDQRPFDKYAADHGIENNFVFTCALFNPGKDNDFLVDYAGTGSKLTPVHLTAADLGYPDVKRTYAALDLFLEHPLRGGWYGKINYTLSRNSGNTEGQTRSDSGQADVSTTAVFDYPELSLYSDGLLPNDRKHQIKAYGFYQFTDEFSVGGNLLAGWQIMMTSALNPDLVGPLVLAGAPLSYWAGVRGKNPLRYLGGILGGTWMTALAGDLGNGVFDGAQLVANFEKMNPSNTFWSKNYNVYSKIDTEAQRFLDFEKWWGNPVLLNAGEMQYIADSLFVGNRLSDAALLDSAGHRIDLRNVKSPIVVFCSWGDDITPPQQALGWVLDLYEDDAALVAGGQTIIYSMHQSIGHLGIFVSASVANKEHEEFTAAMDMIDIMPPGLYEAVFLDKDEEMLQAEIAAGDLAAGDYVMRFERRNLDALRALGGNDVADERRFATVARVSEVNKGLYQTFVSPIVKSMVTETSAEHLREAHPLRMRYTAFSSKNPLLNNIPALAEKVRAQRRPVAKDNVFLQMQEAWSKQIVEALDRYKEVRDQATENIFLSVYGSPLLQALVGLSTDGGKPRRIGRDIAREAAINANRAAAALKTKEGGVTEAIIRALLYIFRSPEMSAADERAFAAMRQLRLRTSDDQEMSVTLLKQILREQYLMLQVNEQAAVDDLPLLLPDEPEARAAALAIVRQVAGATGTLTGEAAARLERIAEMFGPAAPKLAVVRGKKKGA